MSLQIKIKMSGLERVIRLSTRAFDAIYSDLADINISSATRILGKAKEFAPVDTGRLRASLNIQVKEGGLHVQVGTNVRYAKPVEFGSRPHFPPRAPIKLWTRRRKPGYSYMGILWGIANRGIKAQPFLRPAIAEESGRWKANMDSYFEDTGAF